jgi:hypothetical protein
MLNLDDDMGYGEPRAVSPEIETTLDVGVHDGRVTFSVESQLPQIAPAQKSALTSSDVHGGVFQYGKAGGSVPIFVFRFGDWHWDAAYILGAGPDQHRAEVEAALSAGKSSNYAGWSIDFYLVNASTLSTTASRKVFAPPDYWHEVSQRLLDGKCSNPIQQIVAVRRLYRSEPSSAELFKLASKTHRLT